MKHYQSSSSLSSSSLFRSLCYRLYPDARIRISSPGTTARPMVLLFGWGGSVPKNLRKIEEFYDSRNVRTVSFIMPLGCFKFVRDYFIDDLIDVINKNNSNNDPIYVHSYSNNGLWAYADFARRLDEVKVGKIEKLIVDSAPHFIYQQVSISEEARLLSKVVTSIVSKGTYHHPIYTPIIYASLIVMATTSRIITKICQILNFKNMIVPDLIDLSIYLRDNVPKVDTYFIYSSGDSLIETKTIETFQTYWKARDINVQTQKFGDHVPHTSSFYKEGDQYKNIIIKFFNI